ncbi:MAG: DUF2167 domain-containing protein [Chitinophagales bacterium]|nr:DUF2167 domain-containing protein [Chitinophagales bacterium]
MKKFFLFFLALQCVLFVYAQGDSSEIDLKMLEKEVNAKLHYQTGKIDLGDGFAHITIPKGLTFINGKDSRFVLEDLWGNMPDSSVLGMVMPAGVSPISPDSWAFVLTFDKMGYVKDNDADDINYDDLLKDMKNDVIEENKIRKAQGYEEVELIGWASKPFYDKERKALHWAKEIKFGKNEENTINYDIRMLGRRGVLSFNAIGGMSHLPTIKTHINEVIEATAFSSGHKYADFDPKLDEVAAWTIGGLVAGKVLAKVGFLAIIAKFGKVIFLAIAGLFGVIAKFFRGSKGQKDTDIEPMA